MCTPPRARGCHVSCDAKPGHPRVRARSALPDNLLSGTLPASLTNLTSLTSLVRARPRAGAMLFSCRMLVVAIAAARRRAARRRADKHRTAGVVAVARRT